MPQRVFFFYSLSNGLVNIKGKGKQYWHMYSTFNLNAHSVLQQMQSKTPSRGTDELQTAIQSRPTFDAIATDIVNPMSAVGQAVQTKIASDIGDATSVLGAVVRTQIAGDVGDSTSAIGQAVQAKIAADMADANSEIGRVLHGATGNITATVSSQLHAIGDGMLRRFLWGFHRRLYISRVLRNKYGAHYSFDVDTLLVNNETVVIEGRTVYPVQEGQLLQAYQDGLPHHPVIHQGNAVAFLIPKLLQTGVRLDWANALTAPHDTTYLQMAGSSVPHILEKTMYISFLTPPPSTDWATLCSHTHMPQLQYAGATGAIRVVDNSICLDSEQTLLADHCVVISYKITQGNVDLALRTSADNAGWRNISVNHAGLLDITTDPSFFSVHGSMSILSIQIFDSPHTMQQQKAVTLHLYESTSAAPYV